MNLDQLDPAHRDVLLATARRRAVARNAVVYTPGDPSDAVFFVEHGRVKIVRTTAGGESSIIGIRNLGDIFGELGWMAAAPRATSAVAIEPSTVVAVPAPEFERILRHDPAIAKTFVRGLSLRLRAAQEELTELSGKSVAGRLVDVLGRLASEHGVSEDGTVRIALNLTHQDLADLIGTSRETLTKELGVLADIGLVRVAHRTVTLVQPRAFPFAMRRA
jgi:CRP/FNR family transcriptional regulator